MSDDDTLGAALDAAWEEVENEEPTETVVEEAPVEETPAVDEGDGEASPVGDVDEPAPVDVEVAPAEDAAPVGLPPEAREAWKDTPMAVKKALAKRERDFATGIQQNTEKAKRADQMDQALQPFQQFFATNGNNPSETISGVLQTASVLQMGAAPQKAQAIAQLIQQFGVDIPTLDNLLSGQQPAPEQQQQNAMQQAVAQQLAPMQQFMNQFQQQQQYQQQQGQQVIANDITTFSTDPKNEFYADVRADMADILDMAANRGLDMDLKTAYDRACLLRPDIKKIMDGRAAAGTVAASRKAGASIHGTPGGTGEVAAPGSLRESLENAWQTTGRV